MSILMWVLFSIWNCFAILPSYCADSRLHGTLRETLAAGEYTYLRIQTLQGDQWAAIPAAKLKLGATVTVEGSLVMEEYDSKALKRHFKRVVFGTLAGDASGASRAADPHANLIPGHTPGVGHSSLGSQAVRGAAPIHVAKATGSGAVTIAELYERKTKLQGAVVKVRGRVVKYSERILGHNWIHLQDGTGDPKKGTHDIALITDGKSALGEEVTAQGTVALNKDIGSGYFFQALLENAILSTK